MVDQVIEEPQSILEHSNFSEGLPLDDFPKVSMVGTHLEEATPYSRYKDQRGLIIAIELSIIILFCIKYIFPTRFKNTHSKILAFLFVLSSLNMYKKQRVEMDHMQFSHWILFAFQIVQALLHGFKLSSFKRSKPLLLIINFRC